MPEVRPLGFSTMRTVCASTGKPATKARTTRNEERANKAFRTAGTTGGVLPHHPETAHSTSCPQGDPSSAFGTFSLCGGEKAHWPHPSQDSETISRRASSLASPLGVEGRRKSTPASSRNCAALRPAHRETPHPPSAPSPPLRREKAHWPTSLARLRNNLATRKFVSLLPSGSRGEGRALPHHPRNCALYVLPTGRPLIRLRHLLPSAEGRRLTGHIPRKTPKQSRDAQVR